VKFARPSTTLSELAVECSKYGVVHQTIDISFDVIEPVHVTLRCSAVGGVQGRGHTLDEAYDDAFARLVHLMGEQISEGAGT